MNIEKVLITLIFTLIIVISCSSYALIEYGQWYKYATGRLAEQQDKEENSNPYMALENRELWQRGYEDSKTNNPNPLYSY